MRTDTGAPFLTNSVEELYHFYAASGKIDAALYPSKWRLGNNAY
jgi:hypothetical protein